MFINYATDIHIQLVFPSFKSSYSNFLTTGSSCFKAETVILGVVV